MSSISWNGGGRWWTKLQLNEYNQISIAWELDEAPFFFLLLFLSLESFPSFPASSFFAAAGGCVANRCWWIAANGSSRNCGLSSTALRWAASRSLDRTFGFRVQSCSWKTWWPEARKEVWREDYTNVCLDLQFSFALVFCSGAAGSGRNSDSAERSYAFSFFCRRLCLFFCSRGKLNRY